MEEDGEWAREGMEEEDQVVVSSSDQHVEAVIESFWLMNLGYFALLILRMHVSLPLRCCKNGLLILRVTRYRI